MGQQNIKYPSIRQQLRVTYVKSDINKKSFYHIIGDHIVLFFFILNQTFAAQSLYDLLWPEATTFERSQHDHLQTGTATAPLTDNSFTICGWHHFLWPTVTS